jgi:hypothetical protein
MNREQFLKEAPAYYVLGISLAFQRIQAQTFVDAQNICGRMTTDGPRPQRTLLPNSPLFDQAMTILKDQGILEIVEDPFGPALYNCVGNLDEWIGKDGPVQYPLFAKFGRGLDDDWVKEALLAVNQTRQNLRITESDFDTVPDTPDAETDEALPADSQFKIDKDSEEFRSMEIAVGEAIERIEGDNEFASSAPVERQVALSALKTFQKGLAAEAEISWLYVKTFALDPLAEVAQKAGSAGLSAVIQATKAAIYDWLKRNAGDLIKGVLGGS